LSFIAFVFVICKRRESAPVFVAFAFQSCDRSETIPMLDVGENGVFSLRGLA